jgi:hypothetical protein
VSPVREIRASCIALALVLLLPGMAGGGEGTAAGSTTPTSCPATTWTFTTFTTTTTSTSTVTIPSGCAVDGDCDDADACTNERCDTTTGNCVVEDRQCRDHTLCNGIETCDPAIGCVPGVPVDCVDANLCTEDFCHPNLGCLHRPFAVADCLPPDVLDCDDGDPCTANGCDPSLGCTFAPGACLDCTSGPRTDCVGAGRGAGS